MGSQVLMRARQELSCPSSHPSPTFRSNILHGSEHQGGKSFLSCWAISCIKFGYQTSPKPNTGFNVQTISLVFSWVMEFEEPRVT